MTTDALDEWLRQQGAKGRDGERLQVLWSGYGEIRRLWLDGGDAVPRSVVVKEVHPPTERQHPRGWSSPRGHQRKLRSYDVEWCFYERWSLRCDESCHVPRFLGGHRGEGRWLFVLSDLDAEGFDRRRRDLRGGPLGPAGIDSCLRWLAAFHATFLGVAPEGLWPKGTYWHLETRPDELAAMTDETLREAAVPLDGMLAAARFQTFCHGDAKLANFCFAPDEHAVAAVDFQYVGGGPGVKDLAYFIGSVWDGSRLDRNADAAADAYFGHLRQAVERRHPTLDVAALEAEWRALYPIAWADFERFLDGWAPSHDKRTPYARRQVLRALERI